MINSFMAFNPLRVKNTITHNALSLSYMSLITSSIFIIIFWDIFVMINNKFVLNQY